MPELAEVEYHRQRWHRVALDQHIDSLQLKNASRLYRKLSPDALRAALTAATFTDSASAAKQMLFRFTCADRSTAWLGIHLGMTGELRVEPPAYAAAKHDHLILRTAKNTLVFSDPRMFGALQFHHGPDAPAWWTDIAPAVLSGEFTPSAVAAFLKRRARSPLKAVLLMQEKFPGIGNWMADEILWRSALHPRQPAGTLTPAEIKTLHRETRWVAREALRLIGASNSPTLPDPPKTWLFPHRWSDGGTCPKTKQPLQRATIGGRTTCWSPTHQKLHS